MQRGLLSTLIIFIFLYIWFLFYKFYPIITEKITIFNLPEIQHTILLIPVGLIIVVSFLGWAYRNKLWLGFLYSIHHYLFVKRIRRHIKDAKFEDEREFDNQLVRLPKITIKFDDNKTRNSGKIFISNSIKFDKKLENIRIDASLKGYVCERQYLSTNRNWYIYEFYSTNLHNQFEIRTKDHLIKWANETTDDYSLRLDGRATVPLHHMGLVGQTGSGKSFFIQIICAQLLSKKVKHELFVIDPKRADIYQFAKHEIGDKQTADKSNAIELIKLFHKRMEERQNELQDFFKSNRNKTYKDAKLPALILLIDEFGALRESWKTLSKKERDEIDSILSDIAFMGRQLGCLLFVATQQINSQTMPTAIREQLVLKICLGDSGEQTYRTLFSSGVDIASVRFTAGKGVYSYPGLASEDKPLLLVVPFCSFLT